MLSNFIVRQQMKNYTKMQRAYVRSLKTAAAVKSCLCHCPGPVPVYATALTACSLPHLPVVVDVKAAAELT